MSDQSLAPAAPLVERRELAARIRVSDAPNERALRTRKSGWYEVQPGVGNGAEYSGWPMRFLDLLRGTPGPANPRPCFSRRIGSNPWRRALLDTWRCQLTEAGFPRRCCRVAAKRFRCWRRF